MYMTKRYFHHFTIVITTIRGCYRK